MSDGDEWLNLRSGRYNPGKRPRDPLNRSLGSIARAKRDSTRAETRFLLSPKETSPFKSLGASVQSTAGRRGVRISLSNAG